jgi:hypothetical protein
MFHNNPTQAYKSSKAADGSIERVTGGSQWGWGIPAGAKGVLPRDKRVREGLEGEEVEVFISGDYCEWTPYSNVWLLKQQTSSVKAGEGWKKAELEFTTPKWDPFINIKFEMKGKGRAFMDDFQLVPIP